MSIDQYSTTPSGNDLTGYFKTGMKPSQVKDAGWDIMADLASYSVSLPAAGGSANARDKAIGGLSRAALDPAVPRSVTHSILRRYRAAKTAVRSTAGHALSL